MAENAISSTLLDLVACPACEGKLIASAAAAPVALLCTGCGISYPVHDQIPVLIVARGTRKS